MPVSTGTGGTAGECGTVVGVVAQSIAVTPAGLAGEEPVGGELVGREPAGRELVGGELVGGAAAGAGPPAQPPATVSAVRTISALNPFMAVASIGLCSVSSG